MKITILLSFLLALLVQLCSAQYGDGLIRVMGMGRGRGNVNRDRGDWNYGGYSGENRYNMGQGYRSGYGYGPTIDIF